MLELRRPLLLVLTLAACGSSSSKPDAAALMDVDAVAGEARLAVDHTELTLSAGVGCAPARAMVRVRNGGEQPTGALALVAPAPFTFGTNGCQGRALAPAETCDVEVAFAATKLGEVKGTLAVSADPGGSAAVALTAVGYLAEAPNLNPSQLTFGSVVVGSMSAPQTTMLANTGAATAPPMTTMLQGADFAIVADTCNDAVLQPGQSCAVTVVFRPTSIGIKSGTLVVKAGEGCASTGTLAMTGDGLPAPDGGASD